MLCWRMSRVPRPGVPIPRVVWLVMPAAGQHSALGLWRPSDTLRSRDTCHLSVLKRRTVLPSRRGARPSVLKRRVPSLRSQGGPGTGASRRAQETSGVPPRSIGRNAAISGPIGAASAPSPRDARRPPVPRSGRCPVRSTVRRCADPSAIKRRPRRALDHRASDVGAVVHLREGGIVTPAPPSERDPTRPKEACGPSVDREAL